MNIISGKKSPKRLNKGNIDETIRRIQVQLKKAEPGSDQFKQLQEAYEQALKNKKLEKETKWLGVDAGKVAAGVGLSLLGIFALALEVDSPHALKTAQFLVGLVKKL